MREIEIVFFFSGPERVARGGGVRLCRRLRGSGFEQHQQQRDFDGGGQRGEILGTDKTLPHKKQKKNNEVQQKRKRMLYVCTTVHNQIGSDDFVPKGIAIPVFAEIVSSIFPGRRIQASPHRPRGHQRPGGSVQPGRPGEAEGLRRQGGEEEGEGPVHTLLHPAAGHG